MVWRVGDLCDSSSAVSEGNTFVTSYVYACVNLTPRPRTCFSNNGLNSLFRDTFISDLSTKYRMISRSVPGFATDAPCSVIGRGWTTRLVCGGPLFGLCFQMAVDVSLLQWRGMLYWSRAFIFLYKMLTFWLLLTIKHLSSQSIPQTAKNLNLWYEYVWVMGFGPRTHYGNGSYLFNISLTYANFCAKNYALKSALGLFCKPYIFAAQSIHMVIYNDSNWFCAWGCK